MQRKLPLLVWANMATEPTPAYSGGEIACNPKLLDEYPPLTQEYVNSWPASDDDDDESDDTQMPLVETLVLVPVVSSRARTQDNQLVCLTCKKEPSEVHPGYYADLNINCRGCHAFQIDVLRKNGDCPECHQKAKGLSRCECKLCSFCETTVDLCKCPPCAHGNEYPCALCM